MRRNLGTDVLFNTVMMMRMRSRKSVLLTESDLDVELYQKFVSLDHCYVGDATGRPGVLEVLGRFSQCKVRGCAGIIDADADHLLGRAQPRPDVFFTDRTDKETSIIDSPAFDVFCNKLGVTIPVEELRQSLFLSALPLGAIRRLSVRNGLGLDFKQIEMSTFIHPGPRCDIDECCAEVLVRNPHIEITAEILRRFVADTSVQSISPAYVVQGHDLLTILEMQAYSLFGRSVLRRELEFELSSAYSSDHFRITTTYAQLRTWETSQLPTYKLFADNVSQ
jgi:hypothetical protein